MNKLLDRFKQLSKERRDSFWKLVSSSDDINWELAQQLSATQSILIWASIYRAILFKMRITVIGYQFESGINYNGFAPTGYRYPKFLYIKNLTTKNCILDLVETENLDKIPFFYSERAIINAVKHILHELE